MSFHDYYFRSSVHWVHIIPSSLNFSLLNRSNLTIKMKRKTETMKTSRDNDNIDNIFSFLVQCWMTSLCHVDNSECVRQHNNVEAIANVCALGKHISRQTERQTYQRNCWFFFFIYSHVSHNLYKRNARH